MPLILRNANSVSPYLQATIAAVSMSSTLSATRASGMPSTSCELAELGTSTEDPFAEEFRLKAESERDLSQGAAVAFIRSVISRTDPSVAACTFAYVFVSLMLLAFVLASSLFLYMGVACIGSLQLFVCMGAICIAFVNLCCFALVL